MRKVGLIILVLALAAFAGCGKYVTKKSNLVCGDEICDPNIGESVETCPRDCARPPGGGRLPDQNRTIDAVDSFEEDVKNVNQGE